MEDSVALMAISGTLASTGRNHGVPWPHPQRLMGKSSCLLKNQVLVNTAGAIRNVSPFKELPPAPVQCSGQEQTDLSAILPGKPHPKAVVLEAVLGVVLAHESQPPHLPSADLERGSSQMYFKLR